MVVSETRSADHDRIGPFSAFRLALGILNNPFAGSEHIYRRYGRAVEFDLLALPRHAPIKYVFLIGPDYNREALAKSNAIRPAGLWSVKGPPGSAQRAIQDHSFLKSTGVEHDAVAEATNPALKRTRVQGDFERAKALVEDEIVNWPRDRAVDLYGLLRRLAQRVSFTLLFGESDVDRIRRFGDLAFDYHCGNWNWLAYVFPVNVKGTAYHHVLQTAERLKALVCDWVAEGRARPGDDLVSAFARMKDGDGKALSADKILAHMLLFGVASYETMSSATTWTLLLLMLHPEIMADLLDEISASSAFCDIDHAGLSSLKLLDVVVKEGLRLIPPAPLFPLRVFAPCEVAGRALMPSHRIILSPCLTHRLPEVYDFPARFRPQRWFNINPSPYEYLPFSAGPRRCPGFWFGTNFMKLAIAAILSHYRLELDRRARLDWRYTGILAPKPGGALVRVAAQDRAIRAQSAVGTILDCFERPATA
jgi:cytochrome P450